MHGRRGSRLSTLLAALSALVLIGCGVTQNGDNDTACAFSYKCVFAQEGGGQKHIDCQDVGDLKIPQQFKESSPEAGEATENGETWRITAAGYDTAGLYLPFSDNPCSFTLSFSARLSGPQNSEIGGLDPTTQTPKQFGWGYGFGACDLWQANDAYGAQIQYGYIDGGDYVGPTPFPSFQPLPAENEASEAVSGIDVDASWNQWRVTVMNGKLWAYENQGRHIGQGGYSLTDHGAKKNSVEAQLPKNCEGRGIFMRVFNAVAEFRDVRVEPIKV